MLKLIKKEFMLCVHPTSFIFLAFALLVFVPNYPYEVIFFFSALSTYFYCLNARENRDLAFTCALPVKKEYVPLARIMTVVIFQCAQIILVLILSLIKQTVMPAEMLMNGAGISANIALVGNGAVLSGVFNLIFFSMHYKNPDKTGFPFVVSAVAMFLLIAVLIVLRWTTTLFSEILNGTDSDYILAKICAFIIGLTVYAVFTFFACRNSMKYIQSVDV